MVARSTAKSGLTTSESLQVQPEDTGVLVAPAPEQAAETPVEIISAVPKPKRSVSEAQATRIDRMRNYFANQPKVQIRIRKEDGEQWVQINGYAFRIQPGVDVRVPVDVANILRDAGVA